MTQNTTKGKTIFAILLTVAVALTSLRATAQTFTKASAAAEEQTIRALVAQMDNGTRPAMTDDRIFVSGAYPKPMIGKEMSAENRALREKMEKERLNFKQTSRIQRLEVAQAGDMAYEFGYGDLSWDTPEKKHVAFESSYLRVWRKVDGQWKVDVFFARPNEEDKLH